MLKALVSDLAVVAARLRRARTARRRSPPPPRIVAPARISSGPSSGPSAGRVIWRLGIVLLGLGSICAGMLCALMLWVLFGFPLDGGKSNPGSAGQRAEAATLGSSGTVNAAAPALPLAGGPAGAPAAPTPAASPAAASGSSAPAVQPPPPAVKQTQVEARAGSDQPQPAPARPTGSASAAPPAPVAPAQAPPAPTASPAPMRCNVQLCAAEYRSFHASDCTYQPYGGPRRICEAGGRSTEAAPPAPAASAPKVDVAKIETKEPPVAARGEAVAKSGSSARPADASPPPRSLPKDIPAVATAEAAAHSEAAAHWEAPPRTGRQCNVAVCAGRYRSFHAADCTYEPYGGGPRQVCEVADRPAEATSPSRRIPNPPRSGSTDTLVADTDDTADTWEEGARPAAPGRGGRQCDTAYCASTYRSFRAADCTYVPSDGGPRQRCEQ